MIVALEDTEAEITGCETLPELRGKNSYPIAIQQIFEIAHNLDVRTIWMKTWNDNTSTQSEIL